MLHSPGDRMSDKHTPTPWISTKAKFPTDGEYDYAIGATIDGRTFCIAETFGRVHSDYRTPAEANAALIVRAVNSHDALVKALTDLCGLAAMRPGHLQDYKSAVEDARAILAKVTA